MGFLNALNSYTHKSELRESKDERTVFDFRLSTLELRTTKACLPQAFQPAAV